MVETLRDPIQTVLPELIGYWLIRPSPAENKPNPARSYRVQVASCNSKYSAGYRELKIRFMISCSTAEISG